MDTTLQQFWQIDACGSTSDLQGPGPMTKAEEHALGSVMQSLKQVDNRYEVRIPWSHRRSELRGNLEMALRRLRTTERRLLRDNSIAAAYSDVFKQYQTKGYVREVPPLSDDDSAWYLPHSVSALGL